MRSKTKNFRLTPLQLEQLELHIEKERTNFTDFIHSLIQREVMHGAVTVRRMIEEDTEPRLKIKTEVEIIKLYQITDPDLLLALSRIGNNLNQIARALNIIKNADPRDQRKLDIFHVLLVLKGIQNELEQIFPTLPKISRHNPNRLRKQLENLNVDQSQPSIVLAEKDESAY
ncbi:MULTISPECIES: plasmid mobilization relaxosome protein MobC [Acinetobacter]|uniref:plasmid mobilization relaxosome protein MobC n=1 Tax=Acinetobacter TaxID=469 RepID=UPI00044D2676|nr:MULTISPECIES: plasmid mobilization relaxosome protein MobC [Acinetobacter]AUX90250.1 plasmid mobilization relaxosome protein MobC [Acinetobacter sp. ACNIH1]EXA67021.1 bacterial mobilization family protein [Acinetobacter baumannii 348935]MCU4628667.1 MobC family plasmid mobilization relaxosome protein [Acinetobacter variabilis]